MATVKDYLRAFGGRWFIAMSGPLTVPFAVLALWMPSKSAKALFGCLAIGSTIFSSYWVWAVERNKVLDFERKPPSLAINILALYIQKASESPRAEGLEPFINCDIFLHVRMILNEPSSLNLEEFRLTPMLYGNSFHAAWFTGLHSWGLMTTKKQITDAVSLVSGYSITEFPRRLNRREMPVEGWLHFMAYRLRDEDIARNLYRLHISTKTWTTYADISGHENRASSKLRFEKLPERGFDSENSISVNERSDSRREQ